MLSAEANYLLGMHVPLPEPVRARAGDFVFAPANVFHHIHVRGDKPSIRLALSYPGERHRHERE